MEFYTVKDIANMLSVNEETVRRWIREGKLEAERGSGRQGSKISDTALKSFLGENKGLITSTASTTLGIGVLAGAAGIISPIVGFGTPLIGGALLGINVMKKLKSQKHDNKSIKLDLMEEEFELEKKKAQLSVEISRLENEVNLIESQINKIKQLRKEIENQQEK